MNRLGSASKGQTAPQSHASASPLASLHLCNPQKSVDVVTRNDYDSALWSAAAEL